MRIALAACFIALLSNAAYAQWAWKDNNGSTVFSDRPPPADIKPSQILKEPRGSYSSTASAPDPAPSATAPADAPKQKSIAELDADFRKRQMERADSEKKAADESKRKAQLADACERSRAYLRMLDEDRRVRLPNGDVADDAQREAERQRTRATMAEACK